MKDLLNSAFQMADEAKPDSQGLGIPGDLLKMNKAYIIKNVNGLALDVSGGSKDDNAAVITFKPHNGDNQQFKIEQQPDYTLKITAVHSGKALTVTNNNKIVQLTWKGTDEQKWIIEENNNGTVKIINKKTGKVLDIPANSPNERVQLQVHPDNGTPAQRFKLES